MLRRQTAYARLISWEAYQDTVKCEIEKAANVRMPCVPVFRFYVIPDASAATLQILAFRFRYK